MNESTTPDSRDSDNAATPLERDALIRIGGRKADGTEGFHMVGDEHHPDECPGCWAWWGLGLGTRPTQEQLDALERSTT